MFDKEIFDLRISGLSEAMQLSEQWATHTVSLLDPDINSEIIKLPRPNREGLLQRYFFHDITPTTFTKLFKDFKPATSEQIVEILEFTAPLKPTNRLLIHCHAGVSRSTAVACGVLCQHGLTPNEAVKHVFSIRKQAFPNRHILKLFDNILELKGELVAAGEY